MNDFEFLKSKDCSDEGHSGLCKNLKYFCRQNITRTKYEKAHFVLVKYSVSGNPLPDTTDTVHYS